jgi:pimeloyl-ACP methyl ester carboxylesterase
MRSRLVGSIAALLLVVWAPAQAQRVEPVPEVVADSPSTLTAVDEPALSPRPDVAPEPEWLRKPTPDTVVCPFRGRIDYEPGEIECGLIQVPENREVAGSRSIELHYIRILATGKDVDGEPVEKRDDPVIYLTGGPGMGAEYYVEKLKDHGIVGQRDLYILEQRGIGDSSRFCPFFDSRNRASQVHERFADHQRNLFLHAQACIEGARAQGVDLRGYNTFENARDVRTLRQALGLAQWNVWGISYGSVLAQAYVKVDPDGIKALAIDGIVPLDIGDLMRVPTWYARDLDKLTAACAEQPACAEAYPDQQQRYLAAIQSMLDEPVAVTFKPNETWPGGRAWLFADIVAGVPFSLFYDDKAHPAIPAIIEGLIRAVETRDPTFFKAIALAQSMGPADRSFGAGMSLAIRCQDGYVDGIVATAAAELAQHPQLTRAMMGELDLLVDMARACDEGGLPTREPTDYAPLTTDLPVVVTNGAWDPVTPTPLAEYIMPGLSKGRLLEFPHAGHGATRSAKCGGRFLNRFFDDPAAPLDEACASEGEGAQYVAPYFATSAFARLAAEAAEDRKGLLPYGAWLGVSVLLLLAGLIAVVFGWLTRRIDREPRRPGTILRWLTGLTALAGTAHVAGLAIATAVSVRMTSTLLLFGLVGWARWFAWLGPVTGVLGVLALLWSVFGSAAGPARRIGATLVALAAISLALFGWLWDLWPL